MQKSLQHQWRFAPVKHLVSSFGVLFTLCLLAVPGQATTLTFDNCGGSTSAAVFTGTLGCSGGSVNPVYGDRVTGANADAGAPGDRFYTIGSEGATPNVTTSYSNAFGWASGFGLLTNILYAGGDLGILDITFTADPGYRVQVNGFQLGGFFAPEGGFQNVVVSLFEDINTTLYTDTFTVTEQNTTVDTLTIQSSLGGSLTLRLDVRSLAWDPEFFTYDRESVGIDNITFSQSGTGPTAPPQTGPTNENSEVPEPSTFVLMGSAAVLGVWLRRRC
ncbi:MAG: PEP-CTERM sorting domain-containing protein [Bryobacter sp.]|nr:PEP-CTERM sorting domain-containing protein [Bryobacter sp.]